MSSPIDSFDALRDRARAAAAQAHVPFSEEREAAVLLLSDGTWVPGVRVESASFSLVIPPLVNAYTTAVASERRDVIAAALSRPLQSEEQLYLTQAVGKPFTMRIPDLCVHEEDSKVPSLHPQTRLDPFLNNEPPATPPEGVEMARRIARRAHVPASSFLVGCVLEMEDGRLLPGVNVEHPDWTRTLCAERNALGTACSYTAGHARVLYLSCPADPHGSPCGACRQLIVERAPDVDLWMDRGDAPPERARPDDLLPGAFLFEGEEA